MVLESLTPPPKKNKKISHPLHIAPPVTQLRNRSFHIMKRKFSYFSDWFCGLYSFFKLVFVNFVVICVMFIFNAANCAPWVYQLLSNKVCSDYISLVVFLQPTRRGLLVFSSFFADAILIRAWTLTSFWALNSVLERSDCFEHWTLNKA